MLDNEFINKEFLQNCGDSLLVIEKTTKRQNNICLFRCLNPNNKFSKPIGYHKNKQEIFAKKGIDILFVWDYEWFEDFPKNKIINEQTKQKIREFICNG